MSDGEDFGGNGEGGRLPLSVVQQETQRYGPASTPEPPRKIANAPRPDEQPPTGFQRAMGALRVALPLVQRVLPLINPNVGSVVSALMGQQTHGRPMPPPVNLDPIEDRLIDLQSRHHGLHSQVLEQNASLNRIEDNLDAIRDAMERNAQAQKELREDLKAVAGRIKVFGFLVFGMVSLSMLMSVGLYLYLHHLIR